MMGERVIQVIDDHISTAIVISEILTYAGFKVIQSYNSREAIEKCRSEKPDLVFLSLHMAGLSQEGFVDLFPRQRFFVVTAGVGDKAKICNSIYCVDVISKPVDKDILLQKVKKALG